MGDEPFSEGRSENLCFLAESRPRAPTKKTARPLNPLPLPTKLGLLDELTKRLGTAPITMPLRVVRALVVGLALLLAAPAARASPVLDRLVAVVDETPIFLSDVRARAKPYLLRLDAQKHDAAKRAATEARAYRELLEKLIEEELVGRAAKAAYVNVTDAEIDAAVALLSKAANLSREAFLAEVARQGFTEREYRAEIGRQLLEGKWLQIKATRDPGAGPQGAAAHLEAERRRLVRELRDDALIEVRL